MIFCVTGQLGRIRGDENPADLGTKVLDAKTVVARHMEKFGFKKRQDIGLDFRRSGVRGVPGCAQPCRGSSSAVA